MHGLAQRSLTGFALVHLQQTCGKLGTRQRIIGIEAQRVPIEVGGGSVFAIKVWWTEKGNTHRFVTTLRP